MIKTVVTGAAAVVAGDFAGGMPALAVVNVGGLPVSTFLGALGGCYGVALAMGGNKSLMTNAVHAIGALVGAELVQRGVTAVQPSVAAMGIGPVNFARVGGGALGVWASKKVA